MSRRITSTSHLVVIALTVLLTSSLSAAVFEVPSDRVLVERADLIAITTPVSAEVLRGENGQVYTVTTMRVEKSISGESEPLIRVRERGGWLDGRGVLFSGAPQFEVGRRVLLFLSHERGDQYHTFGMALGKFDFVDHEGQTVLVRGLDAGYLCSIADDGIEHREVVRSSRFIDWTSETARHGRSDLEYLTDLGFEDVLATERGVSIATSHRADYLLTGGPTGGPNYPLRWNVFDTGGSIQFFVNGTQSGVNGPAGSQSAAGAWNGSGSDVSMSVSSSCSVCERQPTDNGEMAIILGGAPGDVPATETFAVAAAQYFALTSSYTLDGETFYPLDHADIIVSTNFSGGQALFDAIVTHELGHAIGIRHSNQGIPSSSNAVMNSSVGPIGATLRTWDLDAVLTVYGDGPACRAVSVTGQSPNQTIAYQRSTTLSVSINGDATNPSYQWYMGSSSDFSQASVISGANSSSYNTGSLLTGTYYYWAEVSNACSNDLSDPIVVTVSPCQGATIVTEPADAEITAGDSTTLTVTADGSSPLSFQWYRGMRGNTASPVVGATRGTFNTGPLNATATYWVRVMNSCGTADSRTVTVTVTGGCDLPTIDAHPMSQSVSEGTQVTLMVSATSPNGALSYEWFQVIDEEPVSVSTGSPSYTTPPITETSEFFVEVTDSCGTVVSNIATIDLLECQPPRVDSITQNQQIRFGATASLSVEVTGDRPFTYQWYRGLSGETADPIAGATSSTYTTPPLDEQGFYWVQITNDCASTDSTTVVITPVCLPPVPPSIGVVPIEVLSGSAFTVSWPAQPGVTDYELQESSSPDFASPQTFSVQGLSRQFVRTAETPTRLYYRVRGIAVCDGSIGNFSRAIDVAIIPLPPPETTDFDLSVPEGTTDPIVFDVFVPGTGTPLPFTITTTIDWISVSPSSGTLPAEGMTFTVTADTTQMQFGSNTGTFTVVFGSSGKNASNGGNTTVPVTVSLVTPATTDTKTSPSDASVIIPGVAHASGFNSQWQSDVRLLNVGTSPASLSLKYTPAGADGFSRIKATDVSLKPGVTTAFNDISKNWYGVGSTGDSEVGSLEIRPSSTSLATIASSRTFNKSVSGTFGQFIPPIPFFRFIGMPEAGEATPRLSMQQIEQSDDFRTNVSILEAAGKTTSVTLSVFDASGNLVRELPFTLAPAEQKTLNSLLAANGITLEDGRLELVVNSGEGRVHAYSSVVDNRTNDPFLVPAVDVSTVSATRWILPGVADFQTGQASWRSDVRIFNGGSSAVDADLTFYPQGAGSMPVSFAITIQPNQVMPLDNILRETFGLENVGGAMHITTGTPAKLIATGRTYDQQETGTYGQFIPAVTVDLGFGLESRASYVLQLEESERFRSNLGITEITGNPVLTEITASVPGLAVAPTIQLGLQGFEFTQLNRVLSSFLGTGTAFNGSITIKVIGGEGKIIAYGSVVDNLTQDPTYVPGQ